MDRDVGAATIENVLRRDWDEYRHLSRLAIEGQRDDAERSLIRLLENVTDRTLQARIHNDCGVLASIDGRLAEAIRAFDSAIERAPEWIVPRQNRLRMTSEGNVEVHPEPIAKERQTRIAIISLLFNWPSTGGGTVHTAETGKFLEQAGYHVRHFFAEFAEWGLGTVTEAPLASSQALHFAPNEWNIPSIQARFRKELNAFQPDAVIVTDSWNSKPLLAEAASDYPFFLRIAAQECLCPLNNVRLLFDQGRFRSCPKHQLATPTDCCQCVYRNGKFSGGLHQAEREFVNYGTTEYDRTLRWAFENAEAVLVVNPLIGAMVSPYAKKVCVIPSGFDEARFAEALLDSPRNAGERTQILFAGLVTEPMKGFEVLRRACSQLWSVRQDFELVVTADPPDQVDAFARYIGWNSQAELPRTMRSADIVVCPTIAEEALGRTAVEAMGAGRPVVASRLGGLQFTVLEEATGLLCEPGDMDDLIRQLVRLLDSRELRERMGRAGRDRFERHYTWQVIIDRHYRALFGPPVRKH
jgi:glycosyltransferase involved in cell wall biosynthesis